MTIFLILAPFGSFALLMLVTTAPVSLFAAAAICLAVIAHDLVRGRSIKMLGAGSVLLFGALGCYTTLIDPGVSSSAVKLTVDAGVFAIALLSIAFRFPFTLQYAREMVDAETAKQPGFIRANYIITWAWTAAFLAMMAANVLMIYSPSLPLWAGIAIVFAARNSAVYFTKWYPEYRKAKYATRPASGNALSGI
jgi:intracellular septation protein A